MHRSSFLLVVLCLHCGGQTQTGPAEEAPTTPTEAPAPDTEAPAASPEPAETDSPAAASKDTAAPAEASSKPVCAKLPKSDCKVRKGCAWNDKLKCVEEGP